MTTVVGIRNCGEGKQRILSALNLLYNINIKEILCVFDRKYSVCT